MTPSGDFSLIAVVGVVVVSIFASLSIVFLGKDAFVDLSDSSALKLGMVEGGGDIDIG